MTILALQVRAPDIQAIHSEAELATALVRLWPHAATYVMSFLTLGTFWIGQQTQHHQLAHSDRNVAWLHLAFLLTVVFLPFSTLVLTEFIRFRTALLAYWLNLALIGGAAFSAWTYSMRAGLLKPHVDASMAAAIRRRILRAQTLYALGAALCVFGVVWSIGFILLVQINYAVALPIPWLRRLMA